MTVVTWTDDFSTDHFPFAGGDARYAASGAPASFTVAPDALAVGGGGESWVDETNYVSFGGDVTLFRIWADIASVPVWNPPAGYALLQLGLSSSAQPRDVTFAVNFISGAANAPGGSGPVSTATHGRVELTIDLHGNVSWTVPLDDDGHTQTFTETVTPPDGFPYIGAGGLITYPEGENVPMVLSDWGYEIVSETPPPTQSTVAFVGGGSGALLK